MGLTFIRTKQFIIFINISTTAAITTPRHIADSSICVIEFSLYFFSFWKICNKQNIHSFILFYFFIKLSVRTCHQKNQSNAPIKYYISWERYAIEAISLFSLYSSILQILLQMYVYGHLLLLLLVESAIIVHYNRNKKDTLNIFLTVCVVYVICIYRSMRLVICSHIL